MPELPEVETFRTRLSQGTPETPSLLGRTVRKVQLFWERTLAEPSSQEFFERLPGQTIEEIDRRGKYLMLKLSEDVLLIHLRMSGDLRVEPVEDDLQPHDRLVVEFEDGWRFVFNDTRKFGRTWLVADPQEVLARLGPEPLDPSLTPETFHDMLSARRRQLKPLLLDQTFLAGLGNIYTDEALHRARLHPLTQASNLSREESDRLLESIREVLLDGIRMNGTTIDWVYRGGGFQGELRAYGRTGKPCPVCGTPIERIVVGQRSTHICPCCQPEPDDER